MSLRFPYQSLAEPTFIHEDYAVFADSLYRLPDVPVLPQLFRAELFAAPYEPSLFVIPVETVPSLDAWHNSHPDYCLSGRNRVLSWNAGPIESTVVSPSIPDVDAWKGYEPDFAYGRPPSQPTGPVLGCDPLTNLRADNWEGERPDILFRPKNRIAGYFPATIVPLEQGLYETPPLLAWQGPLPEFARGHKPRPHGDRTAITEPSLFVSVTPLTWKGEQPDFARGLAPREQGQWSGVIEASLLTTPPMDSWFNQQPETARGHAPRPEGDKFSITEPSMVVVPAIDSWMGEQPDFARTHKPRPHGERTAITEPSLFVTPSADSWYGEQPDFARGKRPTPITLGCMPVEASLMFASDVSTWMGVEPVVMHPRRDHAWLPGASVTSTLAPNTGVDATGPWIFEVYTIFVPGVSE